MKQREILVRVAALLSLALVVGLLLAQVLGLGDLEPKIDSTSVLLALLGIVLAFALFSPNSVRAMFERINFLKLPGGVEIRLQAASRAERVISALPQDTDDVGVESRPRGGGASAEYDRVRHLLEERLRSTGRYVLGMPRKTAQARIVREIEHRELLSADELRFVKDLLGEIEDEIGKMPREVRDEYLDAGWRFANRFRTNVFERLTRQALTSAGWFVLDFDQARSHRRDFLAYKRHHWLLIATRVKPSDTEATRKRLHDLSAPFSAIPLVVVPNPRKIVEPKDAYASVPIVRLKDLLGYPD